MQLVLRMHAPTRELIYRLPGPAALTLYSSSDSSSATCRNTS